MTTPLAHVLRLHGPDAHAFAQAQFSSDVSVLEPGHWQWSAWLDARGRVRALLQLIHDGEDGLLALLRGGRAETLRDALQRYILRARVELEAAGPQTLGSGAPVAPGIVERSATTLRLGFGARSLEIGGTAAGWLAADIQDGLPWLPDDALGALLPPALGLYRLGAVATAKGCYPGQEIAARLHFRGNGGKQRLCRLHLQRADGPTGEYLCGGDADAGMILIREGAAALAVVGTEALARGAIPGVQQVWEP